MQRTRENPLSRSRRDDDERPSGPVGYRRRGPVIPTLFPWNPHQYLSIHSAGLGPLQTSIRPASPSKYPRRLVITGLSTTLSREIPTHLLPRLQIVPSLSESIVTV